MKIGDKVVCVDPIYRLVKNNTYVVNSISKCNKSTVIDVGLKTTNQLPSMCRCCSHEFSSSDTAFYDSSRFRKAEPHNFRNELTSKLANKPLIKEGLEKVKEEDLCNI